MHRIFITGASTGIGQALAVYYARSGVVLGLVARREDLLTALKQQLETAGAKCFAYATDVADRLAMEAAIVDFTSHTKGVDLVIANAGIAWNYRDKDVSTKRFADMIDINVNGVIHTIIPFLKNVQQQNQGHFVAISSVAGYRGLPLGAYSASKVAVRYLVESLRLQFGTDTIHFSVMNPGYVDTPITKRHRFRMPFLISAEKAAKLIAQAVAKKRKNYIFPWQWNFVIPLLKCIPERFLRKTVNRVQDK